MEALKIFLKTKIEYATKEMAEVKEKLIAIHMNIF